MEAAYEVVVLEESRMSSFFQTLVPAGQGSRHQEAPAAKVAVVVAFARIVDQEIAMTELVVRLLDKVAPVAQDHLEEVHTGSAGEMERIVDCPGD